MNILFIHETEYIEKMIFEYQIIPEILASLGHRVFVVDFPTHWSKQVRKPIFSIYPEIIENVSRAKKPGTVTLIRPAFVRIPSLGRLTAFFTYFSLIDSVIRQQKIDVVVLFSAPTNGIQSLIAARKHRIPVHFRLLDVLHQLVPAKILQLPAYWFEKIVYRNVDQLTAITPRLRDYAVGMGANPATSRYVPSGSDADLFYYQTKEPLLMNQYGIEPEDIVILFAGTLYNFSGLDKIVSKLSVEILKTPKLKLVIVGSGEQENRLKNQVRELGLGSHVIFTGFVNYPDLPKYINLADVCINPFEINEVTNIIFPGKIYQYLACAKPVLATKLQGMLDIFPIEDENSGIFYYDTVEDFFELLSKVKRRRIKDPNPSLQEITNILEADLKALCEKE